MYWEQLELRCRSLYSGAPPMPPGPAIIGTPGGGPCRCCEQCHAHRAAYSWDGDSRFWAGQAGNFYSPNPGGDEGNRIGTSNNGQRNRSWNWPWSRQRQEPAPMPPPQAQAPPRFHGPMSSSDSQYGFSNGPNNMNEANSTSPQNGYSVIGAPYGVWGPPPPYSDPNSPARRGRYHYIHPNQCHPHSMLEHHIPPNQPILECQNSSATDSHSEQFCQQGPVPVQGQQPRNSVKRQTQFKAKENFENAPSDSDGGQRDRSSNTLPVRKTKKRVDPTANKSIGPNQPQPRVNVQKVFNNLQTESNHQSEASENEYNEPSHPNSEIPSVNPTPQHAKTRRMPQLGIENTGFQPIDAGENGELINGNAESEVYFADVSSCCNISVKNDNYYEDATQRRSNKADKVDADEYLSQRFGKKDSSIRSRLPFPQLEDFEKSANKIVVPAPRPSIIQKETSRQSMCSIDSSEKTDFTDLSPATPTANFQPYPNKSMENYHQHDNFVASFPYNETSQEAHRRSTKNIDIFLSSDSQYETIRDSNQYETTPLTLNYELNHDMSSSSISSSSYSNNKSSPVHYSHNGTPTNKANPKSVNVTPIKRTNLGTNISAIIQNLSSDLYPEQSPQHKQKQDCNDIINDNIVVNSNSCSEKQKEWSELNGNDRRL